MVTNKYAEYRDAVNRALEQCQFVEETLRVYLDVAVQIARSQLAAHFPVDVSGKDLACLSLGRLVALFSRFNGNASLKADLKRITPDRNRIAHQSLLFTLGEIADDAHLSVLTEEVNLIAQRAGRVHEALLDERFKLHRTLCALRRG